MAPYFFWRSAKFIRFSCRNQNFLWYFCQSMLVVFSIPQCIVCNIQYSPTSHIRKSVIRNRLLSGHENQRCDWRKSTFCTQNLNKIYNKNLRCPSLWVFDDIPCMILIKIWVKTTLESTPKPRVGPKLSPNLAISFMAAFQLVSTSCILLFFAALQKQSYVHVCAQNIQYCAANSPHK